MVPTREQITSALMSLSEKHGNEKAVGALTAFLKKSHLLPLMPAVLGLLKKKAEEEGKRDTLVITSATDLQENVVDRISDLAHKDLGTIPGSVHLTVDKSLVGGFVAVYKGKVFDGSVETMLTSLLNKK